MFLLWLKLVNTDPHHHFSLRDYSEYHFHEVKGTGEINIISFTINATRELSHYNEVIDGKKVHVDLTSKIN